jgi:hypothetical protein
MSIADEQLQTGSAFGFSSAKRQIQGLLLKGLENCPHFRVIIDAQNEFGLQIRQSRREIPKVVQLEIMLVARRFIIRWVKVKQGAGLVVGLDELLPGRCSMVTPAIRK